MRRNCGGNGCNALYVRRGKGWRLLLLAGGNRLYSPIVHLQQTDGNASAHKPFTADCNRQGKITAKRVLQAIKKSYDVPVCKELPDRCSEIYLTLELFSGTAQTVRSILRNYSETVQYWREFIPEDGIALDVLLEKLEK